MRIAKGHEAYKKMRDILKTNLYPDLTIADDIQILKIALEYALSIPLLLYNGDCEYQKETQTLLNSLIKQSTEAYEISTSAYEALALKENHAGIIAAVKLPSYQLYDLREKEFLFVLDRLEIPGNIGTIYRTLDAVHADGVILSDGISKLHNPKLTTASRGCNLIIPTVSCKHEEAIAWLMQEGYTVYLGEPDLGLDYQSYTYAGKTAIVVGNERFGIQKDWYNFSHKKVYIPMEGNQNSLNVGVAASVLAYEAYMKRKKTI